MSIARYPALVCGQLVALVILSWLSSLPAAWASPAVVAPEVSSLTRFTSTAHPNVSLRFVSDSGICETTPGVHQMSGYIDVGPNMSMVSYPRFFPPPILCVQHSVCMYSSSGSGSLRLDMHPTLRHSLFGRCSSFSSLISNLFTSPTG